MTQEDKELLLKDLCARLPYGVKGKVKVYTVVPNRYDIDGFHVETTFDADVELTRVDVNTFEIFVNSNTGNDALDNYIWESQTDGAPWTIEEFKPYLRPMSSMTEEEKIELCTISYVPDEMKTIEEKLYVIKTNAENAADFYNMYHFDYRGLIEKGLALEAPEGMYKTNDIDSNHGKE